MFGQSTDGGPLAASGYVGRHGRHDGEVSGEREIIDTVDALAERIAAFPTMIIFLSRPRWAVLPLGKGLTGCPVRRVAGSLRCACRA